MKRTVPVMLDTLHTLALAVWLGGLVLFWGIMVSGVEHGSITGIGDLNRALAGSWHSLGTWIERCGVVMVAAQWLLRRRYQRVRILYVGDGIRQLLTFGALFLAEFVRYGSPHSVAPASGGKMNPTLLGVSIAQMALLTAIMALTAWLQLPRGTAAQPVTTAAAKTQSEPPRMSAPPPSKHRRSK